MRRLLLVDAAEYCAVSTRTLRREVAEGKVLVCRIRGTIGFRIEDLDAYLAQHVERRDDEGVCP